MFNIHQFISALQSFQVSSWEAFFVNTNVRPFTNLAQILTRTATTG
jgi:hypothetical protein